jgi:hypothetical protein
MLQAVAVERHHRRFGDRKETGADKQQKDSAYLRP